MDLLARLGRPVFQGVLAASFSDNAASSSSSESTLLAPDRAALSAAPSLRSIDFNPFFVESRAVLDPFEAPFLSLAAYSFAHRWMSLLWVALSSGSTPWLRRLSITLASLSFRFALSKGSGPSALGSDIVTERRVEEGVWDLVEEVSDMLKGGL